MRHHIAAVLRISRWGALGVVATGVIGVLVVFSAPLWVRVIVPSVQLTEPVGGDVIILGADDAELARVSTGIAFQPLPAKDVTGTIRKAVVATEDRRFFDHDGVDEFGTLRAVWSNALGNPVQGGSTITQQLARNETDIGRARKISRKLNEVVYAWRLETQHDKEWLLRRYLDTVWLGDGVRGVETAAQAWYGTTASELTWAQSAQIAAALPCPETCNPYRAPVRAEERRQVVLKVLIKQGLMTKAQAKQAMAVPPLLPKPDRVTSGDFWILDTVRRELRREGLEGFGDGQWPGGITIKTTIDPVAQQGARDAIAAVLGDPSKAQPELDSAVVMVEPATGGITAIVGGRDSTRSQVNIALGTNGGGSGRQIGSIAKTFALLAALADGLDADTLIDAPFEVVVGDKAVRNHDLTGWGRISLASATRHSVNTAFISLTTLVGPEKVAAMARRFGVDVPSDTDARVAIGVNESDPVTLAGVYAALANRGQWNEPHIVRSVDRGVRTLWEAKPKTRRVVDEMTADAAVDVLRGVVRSGTGFRATLAAGTIDQFGKTGTTDNSVDTWFVGATSSQAGAVWIGNPSGQIPVGRVGVYAGASGGGAPADIWKRAVKAALAGSVPPALAAAESNAPVKNTTNDGSTEPPLEESPEDGSGVDPSTYPLDPGGTSGSTEPGGIPPGDATTAPGNSGESADGIPNSQSPETPTGSGISVAPPGR